MIREELTDELLAKIPVFDKLTAGERHQVADVATLLHAKPGETLVQQGNQSRQFWILVEGTCEVVRSVEKPEQGTEEFLLAELDPYEHFGEMSFFESHPHSASVRAKSPAKLMRISYNDYLELIDGECPCAYKLTYNIVNSLAARLRRMDDWVAELLTKVPEAAQEPPKKQSEWSVFRDKLFGEWS